MPNPLANDLAHVLDHTRELWEELRGQRIFITGGTGFFGCWLLETFTHACDELDLKAEAVILTRRPSAFHNKAPHLCEHPAVRLYAGDVRTFDFPQGSFSHVIHAATEAASSLGRDDPLQMLDTIIQGTRRTLDFAVAAGAQRFLLTSSGAVYGKQPAELTHIPESYAGAPDTMDPASAYGEGKRVAELLCTLYSQKHGIETKIARGFAFVGPYMALDAHFAIGNFIRDALSGRTIEVKGDGTPHRSYLYAADLAIWLWTILFRGQSCQPYNVGSDLALTIAELASTVPPACGSPSEVSIFGPPGRQAGYVPAAARAQDELGLEEWIPLAQAVRRTFDYHAQSRDLGQSMTLQSLSPQSVPSGAR